MKQNKVKGKQAELNIIPVPISVHHLPAHNNMYIFSSKTERK